MNNEEDEDLAEESVKREVNTTYTGSVGVSDHGEFVGRDKVEGDQIREEWNVYGDQGYEYNANDGEVAFINVLNWLFGLFGDGLYDIIEDIPIWPIGMVYVVGYFTAFSFNLISYSSFLLLAIPLFVIILLLLFDLRAEEYSCPQCGLFTVRVEKSKKVGEPLMRVEHWCTECGEVLQSDMYELETQNQHPSR